MWFFGTHPTRFYGFGVVFFVNCFVEEGLVVVEVDCVVHDAVAKFGTARGMK